MTQGGALGRSGAQEAFWGARVCLQSWEGEEGEQV